MILRFTLYFLLLLPVSSFAQTIRFDEDKISFYLQDNEGETVPCKHELLSHVPWWQVSCGKRHYTVNTWIQMAHNKEQNMTKATLMYDVSEGLASSGEKLVQFHSHYTHMYVESLTYLQKVSSDMDVQNGQMNLVMSADLR